MRKQKLDIEIIAYHGWGFSSSFWDNWKTILPEDVQFKTADRGYFMDEQTPVFSGSSKHQVLFLHSYGLYWCPEEQIEQASCIIIFNGFHHFHPNVERKGTESENEMQKMISEFENNPKKILKGYWKKVFHPHNNKNIAKGKFDTDLLAKDLQELDSKSFNLQILKNGKPIISLDGGSDKILTNSRGKAFTEITEGNAVYHFIKEAGHGLPATHYQECWSFISAMIPIFQHNGNYRRKKHQQNSP